MNNSYVKIGDQDDRFYENFSSILDDVSNESHGKQKTEEVRRLKIFLDALKGQWGLSRVEGLLKKEGLRAIYLRNLMEAVLHHCLKCNDTEGAYAKYDHKGFLDLYTEINSRIQVKK